MTFELRFALKYLIPKKKQLSTSLIAFASVGVISLVVWLLLVFLSITEGIERGWLQKLTALHAPLRITPKEAYFRSYYYRIDEYAGLSGFASKTIGEKAASLCDPYSPQSDEELPPHFPRPDKRADGTLVDPVKDLFALLTSLAPSVPGLTFQDFELSGALMTLHIGSREGMGNEIHQATYLSTIPTKSRQLRSLIEEGDLDANNGVFLPKTLKDLGVKVGDRGAFRYSAWSAGAVQEHRLPFTVAGFYNPGLLPIGNRCALVPREMTTLINAHPSSFQLSPSESNGIQVWLDDLADVERLKERIVQALRAQEIDAYWNVHTFKEYPFAQELLHQFQSDRALFTLIGMLILLIATCNIISLLLFLVNDKRREIGILAAMGASRRSIGLLFACTGTIVGACGCLFGIGAATLTLRFLQPIVHALHFLQGNSAFNPEMFSGGLPSQLSSYALWIALLLTPTLACCAALIPALKASRLQPFEALKQ